AALLRWRPGRGLVAAWIGVSLILIACGPYAISQVDTGGRYRNAFGALWPVRVTSPGNSGHENWRKSPFPVAAGSAGDLVRYRGAASGRNVVMILLESTAAQYWPVSQPAMDPMPNLTALASEAISFQHAY